MISDAALEKMLLQENYVSAEDIARARAYVATHHTTFPDALFALNIVTSDLLGQAIAESYGVAYADLNTHQPSPAQIQVIPEAAARKFRIVVFRQDKKDVVVATDDPKKTGLSEELKKIFSGDKVSLAYSLPEDIDALFLSYRKPLATRFTKIIEGKTRVAPEIIEEIIADAVAFHSSDIHFEPQEKEVVIRFRIDGVLHEAGRIPKQYYDNILNRMKVSAHLRIDEHFSAQDGAIRYAAGQTPVDMRISIIPTLDGEKIAIRLLSSYVKTFSLNDLGLSAEHQGMLTESAAKPFGMILTVGPTGSGKTTTLYALLKLLNDPEVNITTIEDPVEYKILGVNQIQVNNQTNLTFAQGLRSIVRQDPDIILVGEVRDRETAEICVNAALTGHLLLSTFHANDAATAIPRILDMGIEPFLLASTLEVIMCQRLARRICENCRAGVPTELATIKSIFSQADPYFSGTVTLYKGKGCQACNGLGYKGRVALFEFIRVTNEMRDLILRHPSAQDIWRLAAEQGAKGMFDDGIDKVKKGITTLEELLRVAVPPQLTPYVKASKKGKASVGTRV